MANSQTVMLDDVIRMDNTKRSVFVLCPRKFQLAHLCGLQPVMGSTALRFGSTWHKILEVFYSVIKSEGWSSRDKAIHEALSSGKAHWDKESEGRIFIEDYRSWETLVEVFISYLGEFGLDESIATVKHTELRFSVEMELVTDWEKVLFDHLPKIIFTGRIDLQLELSYDPWYVEFKTTGQNLVQQEYRLRRNPQILGYAYAATQVLDFIPMGCLVSIVQVSSRKNKDGVYGKNTIAFKRIPQIFTDYDISNWKMGFLSTCSDLFTRSNNGFYEMRHDSCYTYGPCTFTRICEQKRYQEIDEEDIIASPPEGYIVQFWDVEEDED